MEEIQPHAFFAAALNDEAPKKVTAEELAKGLKEHTVILVDLRSPDEFAQNHIDGAINIPVTELHDKVLAKVLPNKGGTIVVYCTDQLMPTRRIALTTLGQPSLRQLGYSDVRLLENLWLRPDARGLEKIETPGGLVFKKNAKK